MKRLRLTVTGLGLVMLMMMGILVQSQFAPYSAFAQPAPTHATPVLGDYGYTYNIQPTLSVFSVYNVWGEAKSEIINGIFSYAISNLRC